MFGSLFWILGFVVLSLAVFILVPVNRVMKLIPFALVTGFMLSLILMYFFVNVFHLWRFNYTAVFSFAGIPIFASLSWTPAVILYAHYLGRMETRTAYYGYTAAVAVIIAVVVQGLVLAGYLVFIRWNFFYTFVMGFVIFLGVSFYLSRQALAKRRA